jgi:U3 small nucleolar RNA-associated protein 7
MPYLRYQKMGENNNNLRFVPFEDLMGLSISKGFSSIVVPGSGVAFFDTNENNSFESKK